MKSLSLVLGFVLVASMAGSTFAADKKAERAKRPVGARGGFGSGELLSQLPKTITLTAEQQTKVDALKKEYAPKLKELSDKRDSVLTAEHKKKIAEAMKKARDDGKKGREAYQAAQDSLQLTAEQKKTLDESNKELLALGMTIRGKLRDILTKEQQEKLPARGKRPAKVA